MIVHAYERLTRLRAGLILLALCAASCNWEIPTSVTVQAGPSFEFAGSGRLAKFTVYAPRTGRRIASPNSELSTIIWQIVPLKGYMAGDPVGQ
jgi:hypothetical protein